jgi:hypothetical protein
MAKFSYNDYLNYFVGKVYGSQTLCKLLYYDESNPLTYPDIADTTILHTDENNQRIMFTPFTLNVDDARMTRLSIMLNTIDVDDIDYFRVITINCMITCHNNLWELDTTDYIKTRPLLIWDELEILFNDKYTTTGLGKKEMSVGNLVYFNSNFTGYNIHFTGFNLPPTDG